MAKRKQLKQKPQKLSLKQKKFAEEYVKSGGNGTKSALKAYNTQNPNIANNIAVENQRKPLIRQYIDTLLNNAKTSETIKKTLRKGLQANQPIIVDKSIRGYHPNYKERRKYAELLLNLADAFPKKIVENRNFSVNIIKRYNDMDTNDVKEELQEILEKL